MFMHAGLRSLPGEREKTELQDFASVTRSDDSDLGIHQRGVQSEGVAVDGGSII